MLLERRLLVLMYPWEARGMALRDPSILEVLG